MQHVCGNEWDVLLEDEWQKPYFEALSHFVDEERQTFAVYPPETDVFHALRATAYSAVRVVILGQDPYHEAGQAHGLAFSVPRGVKKPPSLDNIFLELYNDTGTDNRSSPGDLSAWAAQGVLLLNTVLTVRAHEANSHRGHGWETLTDRVIRYLNLRVDPIVFFLWGAPARKKRALLTNPAHLILEAAHPSPLSAHQGFFGCGHFSRANQFLQDHGFSPVDWSIS